MAAAEKEVKENLVRPREKEIARLKGKRAEGTLATSERARAHRKRHPCAVKGVLSREQWKT